MVSSTRPPAISGVSVGSNATVMVVYPSIACTGLGRGLGKLYDSIPTRIGGIKLSNLLFVLPTAPIAALIYLILKVSGERYVLTNDSVQRWKSFGSLRLGSVNLADVDQVVVHREPGAEFYKAADLYLLGKTGDRLMVLSGVPYADIFRRTILEARESRTQVAAALETIRARQ